MANPFIHVELNTTSLPKAKKFYAKLFKWKLSEMEVPKGPYTVIKVGKGTGGGMMKQLRPKEGSAWLPYVLVDDIDASTKKAKKLGAKIMIDGEEVPGMGWLSIFVDPTGAELGLWEVNPKMKK